MPNTPHDRLFKAVFSVREEAAAWFEGALPARLVRLLDLSTLEQVDGSFVDEQLGERHADLLYRTLTRDREPVFLFLVFEHQSTPDPRMPWRVLRYTVRVWERWVRDNPEAMRLPPVVPVVLYQGRPRWTAPATLREQIDGDDDLLEALGELGVDLRYALADLGRLDDDALWGRSLGVMAQLLMKHSADGVLWERLGDWIETLAAVWHESGLGAVELVLRYIGHVDPRPPGPQVERLLREHVEPEAVEMAMSWADQLREEGLQQGRREGLERGKAEGLQETLLRLIGARFGTVPQRARAWAEAADLEALSAALDRILVAASVEEVLGD